MQSNNQRRTFRGRGRPTDGNIPQRPHRRAPYHHKKNQTHIIPNINKNINIIVVVVDEHEVTHASSHQTQDYNHSISSDGEESIRITDSVSASNAIVEEKSKEVDPKLYKEIQALQTRIQNIQTSIRLSSSSLCDPNNYEMNCLHAVSKTVVTWRSILAYHEEIIVLQSMDMECSMCIGIVKESALLIFQLLQSSVKCGPLSGSKPGYFRRCGSDTAKKVYIFLEGLEPLEGLYFTEKQVTVIRKWLSDAKDLSEKDVLPSKSLSKKKK